MNTEQGKPGMSGENISELSDKILDTIMDETDLNGESSGHLTNCLILVFNEETSLLQSELTQLRTTIEELRKPKWISVDDSQPKDGEAVMVHLSSGWITLAYKKKPIYRGTQVIVNWQCFGDMEKVTELSDNTITHWQPLPSPPPVNPTLK